MRPNLAKNLHPISAGQGEIKQDQIERMFANPLQTRLSAGWNLYRESFQLQQGLQRVTNFRFIVDDENRAGHTGTPVQTRPWNHYCF